MRRIAVPAAAMVLAATLSGCGTINRLTRPLGQAAATLFTSATLADLQMTGIKTGPLIPVQAGPTGTSVLGTETRQELASVFGQAPLGVLLPITRVGETTSWWIFCPAGELQARCEEIPANARVALSGRPFGHGAGVVLLPTRLTWSAQ